MACPKLSVKLPWRSKALIPHDERTPVRSRGVSSAIALRIVVSTGLVLGIVEYARLPDGSEFSETQPSSTPLIEQRRVEGVIRKRPLSVQHRWVNLSGISPHVLRAVIVAEDSRFFTHHGLDYDQMWEALKQGIRQLRVPRGASTITQQLAKNLYLSPTKNPIRKLKEAVIARRMERELSKYRILELYLNVIEWGDGLFGVEAAARNYFRKSAGRLTANEAAYLAAIIPNPRTVYNPHLHPRRVAARQKLILRRMNQIVLPSRAVRSRPGIRSR